MLNAAELEAYLEQHSVPPAAQAYIRRVRSSPPARLIGGGRTNVPIWYQSKKMGRTIGCESATVEGTYALDCEMDSDVFEYWDQPEQVSVVRTTSGGKKRRGTYTADFLVLLASGPVVAQIKSETEVIRLLEERPSDWRKEGNSFHYAPADVAYAEIGLPHIVIPVASNSLIRSANNKLLIQSLAHEESSDTELIAKIEQALAEKASMTLRELAETTGENDYTALIRLIASGRLYARLSDELLCEDESLYVSLDRHLADYFYDMRRRERVLRPSSCNSAISISRVPNELGARRALARLEVLKGENCRSKRQLRKIVAEGAKNGLTAFQSLIPNYHQSGNRTSKIVPPVREFLIGYLESHWKDLAKLKTAIAYRSYKASFEKDHPGLSPVSRPTFKVYLDRIGREALAEAKGGKRMGNAAQAPSDPVVRYLRKSVPFNYASIDHAQAKRYVVVGVVNGKVMAVKPWVTFLVDCDTGAVLGRFVSLKPPSRIACAMVLRDCVRKHGKLPKAIIMDGGAEFRSVYLHSLAAHLGIDLHDRPAAHPRYGSEVERVFGEMSTEWLSALEGNSVDKKNLRSVSASHHPKNTAKASVTEFLEELDTYLDARDGKLKLDSGETISDRFARGVQLYPFVGVPVELNHEFMLATAVDIRKFTYKPTSGLHIGPRHFVPRGIQKPDVKAKDVEVRIEPENPYIVYARFNDEWVTCVAGGIRAYESLSSREQEARAVLLNDAHKYWVQLQEDAQVEILRKQTELADQRRNEQINNSPAELVDLNKAAENNIFQKTRLEDVDDLAISDWIESW